MKLKFLEEFELFTGIKHEIPLCCIIFYECVWLTSIRKQIPEYTEKMWDLSEQSGVLLCPECLVKTISNNLRESDKKTMPVIPN